MRQYFFYATLLIASIYLSACVPSTVNIRPALAAPPSSEEAGFGVVVARVIHTDSGGAPFNYLRLEPSNLNSSADVKSEDLTAITVPLSSGSFYVSSIPAGTYSLSYIRTYYSDGQFYISKWVKGGLDLGTLEVREGVLTDLGELIFYPKSEGDTIKYKLARIPNSNNSALLKNVRPEISDHFTDVTTWNDDGNESERQDFFAAAAQNPVGYNVQYHDPNSGTTYFAGKLGFILGYNENGEWQADAIDTNNEIFALTTLSDGTIVAGGEFGSLFKKSLDGEWQKLEYSPKLTIRDIRANDDNSVNILGVGLRHAKLSRHPLTPGETAEPIAKYNLDYGWGSNSGEWFDKEREARVEANKLKKAKREEQLDKKKSVTERRYIKYAYGKTIEDNVHYFVGVAKPYTNYQSPLDGVSKRETHVFDSSSARLNKVTDFGEGVDQVYQAGTELIGRKYAGFWSWDGRDTFVKRSRTAPFTWEKISRYWDRCPDQPADSTTCPLENGRTKRRRKAVNFSSLPYFWDQNTGIVFVSWTELPLFSSEKETKTATLKTTNGGKSWAMLTDEWPGEYCAGIIPEVKDRILVSCNGLSSDFYESKDKGETWSRVRETENF